MADSHRGGCGRHLLVLQAASGTARTDQEVASAIGTRFFDEHAAATGAVNQARLDLRAFLRANDALFGQVRRGGYELGFRYQLPDPA